MAYVYQEYPKFLYHPELAPQGKVFQSASETVGLNDNGWVDTPAKFPAAILTEALARLDARTFEQFVVDVLKESGQYQRVGSEVAVGGFRADIAAFQAADQMKPSVVFEVKKSAIATPELVRAVHRQMSAMSALLPDVQRVLVVSGKLSEDAQALATQFGMSCLDVEALLRLTSDSVAKRWSIGLPPRTPSPSHPAQDIRNLEQELQAIEPGETEALKYQRCVADIVEYLFVPPLGPVHYEDADADKRNRRDLIVENWAPDGFWAQLRSTYSADQIVVDAKNFAGPVGKRPVIDLAHYLKPYGCGMFGLIVTRKPPSKAAEHALREQWIGGHKLILILSDDVVLEMLRLKGRGAKVEEVLRNQISAFRKSL